MSLARVQQSNEGQSTAGNRDQADRIGTETGLMAQNLWTLALILGLAKTRLDLFHSRPVLNHLVVGETQIPGT